MYKLALYTASHSEQGESSEQAINKITEVLRGNTTTITDLKKESGLNEAYKVLSSTRRELRRTLITEQRAIAARRVISERRD